MLVPGELAASSRSRFLLPRGAEDAKLTVAIYFAEQFEGLTERHAAHLYESRPHLAFIFVRKEPVQIDALARLQRLRKMRHYGIHDDPALGRDLFDGLPGPESPVRFPD